jgi:superfamily II DNA or RNA helicase
MQLYDYQQECANVLENNTKGIVCLPTGTGKTLIQATTIANDIINNKNSFRLYVVNAPRIMLSFQLMKEVYSILISSGLEALYMCVHSGGQNDTEDLERIRMDYNNVNDKNIIPYSQIESSTSPLNIRKMIDKAKLLNLPLVLFSTYNSADRIEKARTIVNSTKTIYDKINIVMNDEAHYLIQERFYDILTILKSERCYFFTATMIQTPSKLGRGMNNIESYGDVLYSMTPREAIDKGRMIRPRTI